MRYWSRKLCRYSIFSLFALQFVYFIYHNVNRALYYPTLTGAYCGPKAVTTDPVDDSLYIRQCSLTNIDACQRISNQTLLFRMTNTAGFASEINNVLRSFVYAIHNRRRFLIDDKNWNYGPFPSVFNTSRGHFSPWLPPSTDCHRRMFVHMIDYQSDKRSIPAHLTVGRDSNGGFTTLNTEMKTYESDRKVLETRRRVARYLWETMNDPTRAFLQQSIKQVQIQTINYAMHIRRGDKLREEAKYIGIERYIESVEHLMKQDGTNGTESRVFVASDKFNTIDELRQMRPQWNFVQSLSFHSSSYPLFPGHFQMNFNRLSTEEKLDSTLLLMVDVEILSRVNRVVCTFSSNICRLVQILRTQPPETVVSLDAEWYPQ